MLKHNLQKGFSMIELLVTILVFAVGLLGIASLQTTGMRLAHDGEKQSVAMMLATSMVDRFRAGASAADYNNVDASDRSCEETASCSGSQQDVFEWNDEISEFLPNGSGTVSTNGDTVNVTISWQTRDDDSSSTTPKTNTYTLPVRL